MTACRAVPAHRTPQGDRVLADWTVTLGSANNRRGAVLPGLRVVVSANPSGQIQHWLTDRHDLPATEVVQLYRLRWQIELFFRWLKRALGASRPLGHSRAAVWLTLLLALVVTLVAMLLEPLCPTSSSRLSWLRTLGHSLLISFYDG
jgi:IS4 transposase